MAFSGFGKPSLRFFKQLEKNNTREWFAPRKQTFEQEVRKPMIELVTVVNEQLRKFAMDYVVENPAKAIFRIYRDTRFSKDKTPYKTHIAAAFEQRGMTRHAAAGFYFAVSHKEVEVAGGMYMPGPEELAAVRAALARDPLPLQSLTTQKKPLRAVGPLLGEKASRVPKAFDPRHPAGEWLKFKQFYYYVGLDAELALTRRVVKEIVDRFKLMQPTVQWLNDAVVAGRTDEEDPTPKRPEPMW